MEGFLGKLGKRLCVEVTVASSIRRKGWINPSRKLIIARDKFGNILTFNSFAPLNRGDLIVIEGLVKHHRFFNNKEQTHLTKTIISVTERGTLDNG